MGMELTVSLAGAPDWKAARDLLASRGFPVQVRMIDGALAFPDEEPPESWGELRLGTAAGMVTVRRDSERLAFVIWGNADAPLRQTWYALAWAFAAAGGGRVLIDEVEFDAAEFRQRVELPATLRDGSKTP